ncbi:DDE-type integrase/transposase/recombinase [uncultured Ilyobacter sp.]|uniref:DDE-type integrase/transposase/recombinase n=1 Tax=uncultured Ilyobacter sp. TaxID=544433 RepID=UPI0029C035CC|nr:DDE-type integrase/transposase/recombinase [uncultured Ilyobacter sp.]
MGLPKSTYYYYKDKHKKYKTVKPKRAGAKPKGYSFNFKSEKVSDDKIKELLKSYDVTRECAYGYIHGIGRVFYACEIIDVFDRSIIDYHIGFSCTAEDVCNSLIRAVNKRLEIMPEELYIRSDNGSQFTNKLFSDTCRVLRINHERIPNTTPNKNAHIEAFHSILERGVFG